MKAVILTIGSELTGGRIVDTNAAWAAAELTKRGVQVTLKLTVDDDPAAINGALKVAGPHGDLVWITGGMGVTRDDLTVETVARMLGARLAEDEATAGRVRKSCAARGRIPNALQMRQALVPEGAEVMPNPVGLAPGLLMERDGRILLMLPGVPAEMKAIATESVFPRLRRYFRPAAHRTLHVGGLPESSVNEAISELWNGLGSGEKFGLQAVPGEVLLQISVVGEAEASCRERAETLEREARSRLERAGAELSGIPFEERVISALRDAGAKLALAESVTGGLIASRLSSIPGASDVLCGGWVAYRGEAKIRMLGIDPAVLAEHGAVSEKTALLMASAARRIAECAIAAATTGWAGPEGGTERDPVGTVYVACSAGEKEACRRLSLGGGREIVRQHAANAALRMILAAIKGE